MPLPAGCANLYQEHLLAGFPVYREEHLVTVGDYAARGSYNNLGQISSKIRFFPGEYFPEITDSLEKEGKEEKERHLYWQRKASELGCK